jgi:hypothetical protein
VLLDIKAGLSLSCCQENLICWKKIDLKIVKAALMNFYSKKKNQKSSLILFLIYMQPS